MQAELVDPDFVFVLRVDVDVVEVERPGAQALAAVDERPRFAGVIGAVQAAFVAGRFDHRVDDAWIAARDVDIDLADQFAGQAGADLFPGLAAVNRLEDAAFRRGAAADDVPALAEAFVHGRVKDVRVLPIDFDVAAARFVVDEQRLLPRLAAIGRLEDAALVVRTKRRSQRREPHRIGVHRVHLDAADLAGVLQAHELPLRAAVSRLVDAAADDDVRADRGAAGADPHVIGIRRRHVNRADRPGRGDLAVADRRPGDPGIVGLPHAAADAAEIKGVRLLPHA